MADLSGMLEKLQSQAEAGLAFTNENIPGGAWGLMIVGAVAYLSAKYLAGNYRLNRTKKKIAARKAKVAANIGRVQARLNQHRNVDLKITELPFLKLQSKLQSGELKAVDVLLAYQAKALQITNEINCVTEFIDDAYEQAVALDRLDSSKRGPLHGIPISLKEAVGVKGTDCTAGLSCFIDDNRDEDGVLLQVLKVQGGVPFARTNLSQGQMSLSCANPLFGETVNPVDKKRTCGGSSGGEGALLAAAGSPCGIACDMAGSIRIPCHFCGVCGLKPTPSRLSGAGNCVMGQGILTVEEVYGPMAQEVAGCVELFKAALTPRLYELDPLLPNLPWRDDIYESTRPLKIGYYLCDGGLEPTSAIKRCILETKMKLEKRGHTFVEFTPPDILYATKDLFFAILNGDDSEGLKEVLKDDVVDASVNALILFTSLPYAIRAFIGKCMTFLHPVEQAAILSKSPKTVNKWWTLNEDIEHYKRKFLNLWKSKGLDAVIAPIFPFSAYPIGDEGSAMAGVTYTSIYNIVGLPTGAVPCGKVEKRDLAQLQQEYPRRNQAEKYVHRISENSEGLPIALQCVGLPYQEEVCFRLMREIEEDRK